MLFRKHQSLRAQNVRKGTIVNLEVLNDPQVQRLQFRCSIWGQKYDPNIAEMISETIIWMAPSVVHERGNFATLCT